jgi:hypothetical protein
LFGFLIPVKKKSKIKKLPKLCNFKFFLSNRILNYLCSTNAFKFLFYFTLKFKDEQKITCISVFFYKCFFFPFQMEHIFFYVSYMLDRKVNKNASVAGIVCFEKKKSNFLLSIFFFVPFQNNSFLLTKKPSLNKSSICSCVLCEMWKWVSLIELRLYKWEMN